MSTAKIEEQIVRRFLRAQDRLVIQASDLSLKSLADMVESGSIDTSPHYQRRERWGSEKQSALIESFLLNVPVPPVFLAEDEYGKYSIVDGKQRLTAIAEFIGNRLKLSKLESFSELDGFTFDRMPKELRNALTVRPYLRVITLLKQSDPQLKYEVFVRLNRGGESMEAQEIRNVAFRGALNTLIYSLSKNDFLKKQLKIKNTLSGAYKLMADAELVLRFFTLKSSWRKASGDLRKGMDDFMVTNRFAKKPTINQLKESFERAIAGCEAIWGEAAFKRPFGAVWRDQFLNGMYDAQMLAIDQLSDGQLTTALAKRRTVLRGTRLLFKDQKFERAVREATNTPSRLRYRVEKMLALLTDS